MPYLNYVQWCGFEGYSNKQNFKRWLSAQAYLYNDTFTVTSITFSWRQSWVMILVAALEKRWYFAGH